MRSTCAGLNGLNLSAAPAIPGIISHGPNRFVEQLKSTPWKDLPRALGKQGERIVTDLLLDCAIFVPLGDSGNVLSQICGQSQRCLAISTR